MSPTRTFARPTRGRQEHGQSLAEFAIVAVPLLLLLLGIVQFALLYNAQIGLTNAVRDVARYGSTLVANQDGSAGTSAGLAASFLQTSLGTYITPYSAAAKGAGTQACYDDYVDSDGVNAARITVTAVYNHPLIVPLIGNIIDAFDGTSDGAYRITVTADLRVDNPPDPVPAITGPICVPA
ncbi:MAG: hypothetical protein HW391_1901 [Chloroflexi bacterium]|nr:hypothetical protein [Chloroflexota bacterium]